MCATLKASRAQGSQLAEPDCMLVGERKGEWRGGRRDSKKGEREGMYHALSLI